ncbi:MAG TPA: multiheme c-type cytochrome [Armatimonadota bacterium]|jgi:predicted CXXCH cytochrome family protein
MKRLFYAIVFALAVGALFVCRDCGLTQVARAELPPAIPPESADMLIDFLGASRGYVEPCGCHSGQYGGIARWATYLKQSRAKNPQELALFAGGARLGQGGPMDEQAPTLWDAYTRMKFDAGTLAAEDLADVPKLTAAEKAWITVANLTDASGKAPFPAALYKRRMNHAGKPVRIGIIGILGDSPFGTMPNPRISPVDQPWRVADPTATLKKVIPEVRKKADIVIVLYAGTRRLAQNLSQDAPGADIMVVGLEGAADTVVEKMDNTAIVQNPDRGRFAVAMSILLDKAGRPAQFSLQTTPISDALKDDPEMIPLVAAYRKKLAVPPASVAASTGAAPPTTTPAAYRSEWAGSFACSSCHAAEFNQWKTTKHAIAMNTLEKQPDGTAARRPDCVKCHVAAFDRPGGFTLSQPRWDLKGVGCESCHGPAGAHVEARLKGLAGAPMLRNPGKAVCVTCHTKDNSPTFDYAKYLPHIQHIHSGPLPELK